MSTKKNYHIIFELYILSLLIGQTLFFVLPVLQIMRLFTIGITVFFLLYLSKYSINKKLLFFLSVFILFFIFVLFSTIRCISTFNINLFINYLLIIFILFNLSIFFTTLDIKLITKSVIKVLYVYLSLCTFVAAWEIVTQNHLPVSKFSNPTKEYFFLYIPTTFFTNENDYMAVYLLLFLLIFSIKKDLLKENFNKLDFVLFISLIVQSFITGARIVQLCIILFFYIYFIQKNIKFLFFSIGLCFLFYLINSEKINSILVEMFTNHGSNEVRKNLYILGFKSLFNKDSTLFLGLGMNGSVNYYKKVHTDLFLGGIEAPHNFLFELILNCGFIFTLLFILFTIFMYVKLRIKKYYYLGSIIFLYFFILCSPAAASFLWPQYIVLFVIFYYANSYKSVSNISIKKMKKNNFLNMVFKYRGN